MNIISRAAWGARHDRGFSAAPLPVREVWLHHSVTIAPDLVPPWTDDDAAVRTLERIGEQRFGGGISYTFAITPSGRTYEGHGIDRRGAHTARRNSTSRAICLVGDYSRRTPTPAQQAAIVELLREGKERGWWVEAKLAGGHRDVSTNGTACPGDAAYKIIGTINRLAAQPKPKPHIPIPPVVKKVLGFKWPLPPGLPTLTIGARGDKVKAIQERVGVRPDGDWGPGTNHAFRAFQRGMGINDDGVYGPDARAAFIKKGRS